MAKLQCVRGTYDLYGAAKRKTKQVVRTGEEVVEKYGFEEIETPIFEFTEVFARNLGDTSDIVTKEMYCFEDRGGESLTLRPEGTAGVVRAFVSNGMQQNLPVKFYYHGQMFRYERPQKGRQRQFTQFGVELLGADTPQADIEVIAMAYEFLEKLGLSGQVTVEVNSLGDAESRNAYREKLVAYLKEHFDELSADSKNRLERNPLRVLDSKEECDKAVVEKAPLYADSLNEKSKAFFAKVLDGLDRLGIKYRVNNRLVRGLDYYSHTVFELVTDKLGAQGTVLAGGRYDGLVHPGVNVSADGVYSPNSTITTDAVDYYNTVIYPRGNTESNVFDTSYLKLKELRVEYLLPRSLCAKTKVFQNVSLSFFVTNVFCITNFPQFDPEVASLSGSSLYRGVETGAYPMTRSYGFSLKLGF